MKLISYANLMCCLIFLSFSSASLGEREIGYENVYQQGSMDIASQQKHKISKRSTPPNIVDIKMFKERSVPGKMYDVYVDSTMKRIIIDITVERSNPTVSLEKPSGVHETNFTVSKIGNSGPVTTTFNTTISYADYGKWILRRQDASIWDVHIRGESSLDFTCQFFQRTSIIEDPIQGETYDVVVTIAGFNTIRDKNKVRLYNIGSLAAYSTVYMITKGGGKFDLSSKLVMPYNDFVIGIEGEDIFGRTFQRIVVIKPIALKLLVPLFNASSVRELYENTSIDIPFTITNKLSRQQNVSIRITDTRGLALSPVAIPATIKPGQNFTGKFVLAGGQAGDKTTVTITAELSHGNYTGPSVSRAFTVRSNHTTTTSTSTSTTTATSTTTSTSMSMSNITSSASHSVSPVGSTTAPVNKNQTTSVAITTVTNQVGSSKPVTTNAGKIISANSKANAVVSKHESKDTSFSKEELFGAASVSGISAGVLIGVAALVTMALVLKKSNKMKKVAPQSDQNTNEPILDHDTAWT